MTLINFRTTRMRVKSSCQPLIQMKVQVNALSQIWYLAEHKTYVQSLEDLYNNYQETTRQFGNIDGLTNVNNNSTIIFRVLNSGVAMVGGGVRAPLPLRPKHM